jgi:DNA-binding MarR family transcriptional regulator
VNYSDAELSRFRTDEEALVEAGVQLLPVVAKALFSAISCLGNAFGLTPAQVKVLLQLGARRQMTVGEIATALDCSMPAASELVDRLVDAGHLHRASDPADRRRVLIAATPESQRISAHLRQLREIQVRHALDRLEPEERPVFVKSLEALIAGLTHVQETPLRDGCLGAPAAGDDSRSLRGSD